VWVDPADGFHTKERILPMAKRAKDLGMGVLIDFHYSDFWADPGRQDTPAAWADYDLDALKAAVYDHTYEVCSALVEQSTPPDIIQIGNEINGGMLWPVGALATYNWESFDELAVLLKQGVKAVKNCSPNTKIMLHLAEAGNYGLLNWWYGNIIEQHVPFDIMGLSYYPFWHGGLDNLQTTLNDIATQYNKDIILVEFAYPFTLETDDSLENIVSDPSLLTAGYPATPEGQRVMTRRIMNIVSQIPKGHGLGVFYWDATWTAVEGNGWDPTDPNSENGWENQALFDFDGVVLPALLEFEGKSSHAADGMGGE
jgi:arabinogalactan endo-1,4-beta-galactosidase